MFVIPVGNRVDWKHPPVVTLLLILANCFVFFFLQGRDGRIEEGAEDYYFSSELPKLELPRYARYLEARGQPFEKSQVPEAVRDRWLLVLMERDGPFMRELRAGRIVVADEEAYPVWRSQRRQYDALIGKSITRRFLFRVDEPSPLTALSAAFLHANFGHLLGNMAVLFLVGFLVETVVGKLRYTVAYGICALVSAYFYAFVHPDAGGGLLGASGAIAGIMGLYTVIFGFRKIDFFYSLGFYFDYVRAPAIALLPLWLGNELYQFYSEDGSQVAYMAHFGGLLSGAALGGIYRLWRPQLIESRHRAGDEGKLDQKAFKQGLELLGAMEFGKASAVFEKLLETRPEDPRLVRQAYLAARFDPAAETFHRAAHRLLSLPAMDTAIHADYLDYQRVAKPGPKLEPDLLARLAMRFAAIGRMEDAEKLARELWFGTPRHRELPAVLLVLARGYHRQGQRDKFASTLERLLRLFPEAPEAGIARTLLNAA